MLNTVGSGAGCFGNRILMKGQELHASFRNPGRI